MADQATLLLAAQEGAAKLTGSLAALQAYPAALVEGYADFVAGRAERYSLEYARRLALETTEDQENTVITDRIKFELNTELDRAIEVFGLSVNMQLDELTELYAALTQTAKVFKKTFDGSFNQMVANETFEATE